MDPTAFVTPPAPLTIEAAEGGRELLRRAAVREILMGAQDNLTNVLAVMVGVSIGSGRGDLVALAGTSAAIAEAVSMGGVLYSSTRAEQRQRAGTAMDGVLSPTASGITTFLAALAGGLVPLVPFLVLPLPGAVLGSIVVSLLALFGLGGWTGRISGGTWWQDGVRLLVVASAGAIAAAVVGTILRVE